MEFPCITQRYVLNFTCIISSCCLQYASVLQAGIIFQAVNWLLFFLYPGTKGIPLGSKCDKTHIHSTKNMKLLHISCMPDNY